jgi:hypothetical protein
MLLKSDVLCFTLCKSRKLYFLRRTCGLAKRAVSFKDSEVYSLAKIFAKDKKILEYKKPDPLSHNMYRMLNLLIFLQIPS